LATDKKSNNKNKRIPDYARRDVAGLYYSQMKLWQGIAFILAISTAILAYFSVFKTKYKYFYTDGYSVVQLKEASPKVDAFLSYALKNILNISYMNFDKQMEVLSFFVTQDTYNSILNGFNAIKGDIIARKVIWVPSNPVITLSKSNEGLKFSADLYLSEVSLVDGKEAKRKVNVSGVVISGDPTGENPYPYKIKDMRIEF
jgi:hypothetical protein